MRKKILIAAGILLVLAVAGLLVVRQMLQLPTDPHELAVGELVPPLRLLNAAGDTTSLLAAAGDAHPVLVVFRGHW